MENVQEWLSLPRWREYLVAADHDASAARELYQWNSAVAASFFELISYVEVALRNAIDRVMRPLEVVDTARVSHHGGWWFANSAFLAQPELQYFDTAVRHLGGGNVVASEDRVIASMTFGLWADLFGPNYETLFRRHLVYAFQNRPARFTREVVHRNVVALRVLRNRIAHHQPILDLPLEERYEQARDVLRWIDQDLERWVTGVCSVPQRLGERPAAAESMAVVVPASDAWPFYQDHAAYVCQPGRYFRQVSHVAFYADGAIQPEIPKVVQVLDHVAWTAEEIGRRFTTHTTEDERIGRIISAARERGWDGDEYQLILLTSPGEAGRRDGHVSLATPVPNTRRGRGTAWVRRQRYASVAAITAATTLSDLDQL